MVRAPREPRPDVVAVPEMAQHAALARDCILWAVGANNTACTPPNKESNCIYM